MALDKNSAVVGFVGTGVMGRNMAGHLLKAGYRLHVHNRTRAKADELVRGGAAWHDAPADLCGPCNVIITMLGMPADVESVYLGPDGLARRARAGATLIDMTTSRPDLAARIEAAARERGLRALDAPVSGGERGSREATLSIMVGGDPDAFAAALPLLQVMGKTIVLQGPAGCGQHAKMANQIAIAGIMIGVCEALAYVRRAGLDPQRVLQSIETGAAGSWSLSNLGPRMLGGDFRPGFYVKHFIKDLTIAQDMAEELSLRAPGLGLAKTLYEELAARGGSEQGTQALYRLYE